MVCAFEREGPQIKAIEIHKWIHENMGIPGHEVIMIQIDGTKRQVYIKVRTQDILEDITRTAGTLTYAQKEGIL
jgi:hypothetical protein